MPKKVAPKLIQTDAVIYAVLSEGNGFLKELYGDVHFDDKLPRASGSFLSKPEAVEAHGRAIVKAREQIEDVKKRGWSGYAVTRAEDVFRQAQDAIVVEIAIRAVI